MQKYRDLFIIKGDFWFFVNNGINVVCILVGYWIVVDLYFFVLYVFSFFEVLDNVFYWVKYENRCFIFFLLFILRFLFVFCFVDGNNMEKFCLCVVMLKYIKIISDYKLI